MPPLLMLGAMPFVLMLDAATNERPLTMPIMNKMPRCRHAHEDDGAQTSARYAR